LRRCIRAAVIQATRADPRPSCPHQRTPGQTSPTDPRSPRGDRRCRRELGRWSTQGRRPSPPTFWAPGNFGPLGSRHCRPFLGRALATLAPGALWRPGRPHGRTRVPEGAQPGSVHRADALAMALAVRGATAEVGQTLTPVWAGVFARGADTNGSSWLNFPLALASALAHGERVMTSRSVIDVRGRSC
jgi:hypothetical protein